MVLDVGKIIGESYNMLFRNGTILKIGIMIAIISALLGTAVSIVIAPLAALQNTLNNTTSLPDLSAILSTAISVAVAVTIISIGVFLVSLVFSGALLSAASVGDKANLGASFARAKSRYLSLLGTSIICGLIVLASMVPGFVIMVAGVVSSGAVGVALVIVGAVLLIVLVFYFTLKLWVSDAACVVGGYGAVESVKRSWNLTKGNFWRILAIVLLTGLISGITGGDRRQDTESCDLGSQSNSRYFCEWFCCGNPGNSDIGGHGARIRATRRSCAGAQAFEIDCGLNL